MSLRLRSFLMKRGKRWRFSFFWKGREFFALLLIWLVFQCSGCISHQEYLKLKEQNAIQARIINLYHQKIQSLQQEIQHLKRRASAGEEK